MDNYTNTLNNPPQVQAPAPQAPANPRDAIRAAVMNSSSDDEIVTAFGVQIAVRPPELRELVQYQDFAQDEHMIARAIVNNCYVPGTNEKVFEETDVEVLSSQRFSTDMRKLNQVINKVLGGNESLGREIEDDTKSNKA